MEAAFRVSALDTLETQMCMRFASAPNQSGFLNILGCLKGEILYFDALLYCRNLRMNNTCYMFSVGCSSLRRRANVPVPALRSVIASPALDAVVKWATAKRPSDRFSSAGEFARAPLAAASGLSGPAR